MTRQRVPLLLWGSNQYLITPLSYYRYNPLPPGAAYRPGKHADQIMNDYYRETALKALAATQRRTR